MYLPRFFPLSLVALLSFATAQLTPSPTYDPPSASSGVVSSTGTPNTQWANVLGNSLWFYDAQRSGKLNAGTYGNRVSWRNDSALSDGSDWNLDLTGGWYDAGDYIKATFPLGFTLFALSWGAFTHGKGYDLSNQTAYLDGTLRWGYDWLIKAHPKTDFLFVQVGSSSVDNAYWGGDQDIPTPRPAYPVNVSHPGTDVWASTAAAFAMASVLYTPNITYNGSTGLGPPSTPSLANATYAKTLLNHAVSLYTSANTTDESTFSDSLPNLGDAYTSSGYADDMALAGLTLALATNQSQYYKDAYTWYTNWTLSGTQEVWNWDSKTPAVYVMFVECAITRPSLAIGAGLNVNLTGWRNEAEKYFDGLVQGTFKNAYLTGGGLLYWNGDSDEASLNPAMAAAMLMFKYAPLASSTDKANQYTNFAQNQLNYMLGKNPMNAVYLVGSHPNSPQNPHSGLSSGGTNINDIRNSPPTEAHVLYGAMVGGPLSSDRFWDWRDDWVQTEIALDYNAMIPTLASMQLMNTTGQDPYYVGVQVGTYSVPGGQPCDAALPCSSGLGGGAIAGIVCGIIGFLFILGGILWWRKHRTGRWFGGSSKGTAAV